MQGISIIVFGLLIMLITTVADLIKDKQFIWLQSQILEENVTVIRGKYGATLSVSVWDIVVGDIILLSVGQRIPADCLIVESSDFSVVDQDQEAGQMRS